MMQKTEMQLKQEDCVSRDDEFDVELPQETNEEDDVVPTQRGSRQEEETEIDSMFIKEPEKRSQNLAMNNY